MREERGASIELLKKEMMAMKIKIALSLLLLLVVLALVAAWVVSAHLGDIVKAGMETVGPRITQTTLTVDSVNLSLWSGSAGIKGLAVGNPEGYQAPQCLSVGSVTVTLEPRTLLRDKVVIHSVELKSADITFEGNPLGENNLVKIMANVNGSPKPAARADNSPPATAAPEEKKAGKKLEIDDFLITGAKVHAHLSGVFNQEVTLPLPDIHLTNLGKGSDGITAAELTQRVLGAITVQTIKTLGTYAVGLGKGVANGLKSAAQDAFKGITQTSTNSVGDSVDKLKKGLGSLFGK